MDKTLFARVWFSYSNGAPSLSVLCFHGLCRDAMPLPIGTILNRLKRAEKPLSYSNVSVKDIRGLQCKINTNPKVELCNEQDNLLTAVLIAFLEELRDSLLAPTTATEFIISASKFCSVLIPIPTKHKFLIPFLFTDNLKNLNNRIALLPRSNRVVFVGILELGYTLAQRGVMGADKFAQLFGPHLYRPLEHIKLNESEYQDTLTILNPGLINLIEKYDGGEMAKLLENFEASSEFLEREYLYSILQDGTCLA